MEKTKAINYIKNIVGKLGNTGFFHVFGSTVINKIIGFASGIVLVWIISKAEYGVFSYANNLLNFFMLLCGLGAVSGMLQMCSENRDASEKKQIYIYASRISLIVNITLSVLIILTASFVPLKIKGANLYLGLLAFLPIFSYIYEMQSFYLRTQLKNKEYSISNTFSTVIIFVLSCTLSYFFKVKGLIVAKYIAFAISALFVLLRYHITYPAIKKPTLSGTTKRIFWNLSLTSMCNNGLSSLMYMLDIFVIGLKIPDSTVIASYKVATQIPTALIFIPTAFITYIYPYFARHREDKEWVRKKYLLVSAVIAAICFSISAVCIICAPLIIRLVFGRAYLDAVPPFRVLCVSFAFSSVFRTLPGNILTTQRKLKFNLFVAVFSSLFNTVMNIIFITKWNSIGAAFATLLTGIVTGILNTVYMIFILKKKS